MKTLEQVKELLLKDYSVKKIAEELKMNPKSISYIISKNKLNGNGISYIKEMNHNFFNIIDSEIKAYLLGYLLADGCVIIEAKRKNGKIYSYSKRLCFTVSIDDLYCLELFRQYISKDSIIRQKQNNKGALNRKISCYLRISSRNMIDVLINKYSIKPNKTKDITFEFNFNLIPKELHRHFLRGFFDGDGCVLGGKNSKISFVGTSKNFMNQIGEILSKELNCSFNIIQTKTWFNMYLKTNNSSNIKSEYLTKNILDYLYKDSNFFFT